MKRKSFLSVAAALFAVSTAFIGSGVAHAGTQICTWTGGGGNSNWSTTANWSCDTGTVPDDGGALVLNPFGATVNANNDLAAANTYTGIDMPTGSTGIYNITGNALRVAGDITNSANATGGWLSIANNLTITANSNISVVVKSPTVNFGANSLVLDGAGFQNTAMSGSGPITLMNYAYIVGNSPSLTSLLTISGGYVTLSASNMGSGVVVNDGASLNIASVSSEVFACVQPSYDLTQATAPITLKGLPYSTNTKLIVGGAVGGCGAGGGADWFMGNGIVGNTFTLSGSLTIQGNDPAISSEYTTLNITGAIDASGRHINSDVKNVGSIVINASSNNSLTANTTLSPATQLITLSDSNANSVGVSAPYKVCINGSRDFAYAYAGGIICGTGTITNDLNLQGGILAPGNSPGILNSGNVTFDSASSLQEELGGTAAGEFDQLNVTGTVNLGGATLNVSLYNSYAPALNSTYKIINNDGADAVTGTFAGLAQGASFAVGEYTYTISYTGGDGNDVVLTVAAVPAPPNTAGVFGKPANIVLGASIVMVGVGLFATRRTMVKKAAVTRKK